MVKKNKKLQNHLVLNRYLCSFFNFKNSREFKSILFNVDEGISQNKKFFFTEALQTLKISDEFRQKLNLYDENIQEYLLHINQKRDPPLNLKYFQYLAVLFTEIHLDNYFNNLDSFISEYESFVMDLNQKGDTNYPFPTKDNLRKICYWSATGSGKTHLMHINYLQIMRYLEDAKQLNKIDNFLLITPNPGLSNQHLEECHADSIDSSYFEFQKSLQDWLFTNPLKILDYFKFKRENALSKSQTTTIPVESFGENNVVFVDEGHKGYSTEKKTWRNIRTKLVGKTGFTFEYSATFGEITGEDEIFNEYASTIIFDYRYKYFYEDGYGKDYSILNLKKDSDYGDEYFAGALLSFYEQKLYFEKNKARIKQFNIKKPLMLFVGSSVLGKKINSAGASDVVIVLNFLSMFVKNKKIFQKYMKNILTGKSSLVDEESNQQIFGKKFSYLRELISSKSLEYDEIYDKMLKSLFGTTSSKNLQLVELKNAVGEIGLKFGDHYFGIINVGDVPGLIKLLEKEDIEYTLSKDNFVDSLFNKLNKPSSTINVLIGAKKFTEGWSSWRVSCMTLLNVGKQEGAQIMQLFGRGIRLKGFNNYLKRSHELINQGMLPHGILIPEHLIVLETLNIYGLKANYVEKFRDLLKEEGVGEYETVRLTIMPNIPKNKLFVPVTNKSLEDFENEVQIVSFNQPIKPVKVDISSKISILNSDKQMNYVDESSSIVPNKIEKELLRLIDFESIYIELLKYKSLKNYFNIYFTKQNLMDIVEKNNYEIFSITDMLTLQKDESLLKLEKIQSYIVQILKATLDKIFNHEKFMWYQNNSSFKNIESKVGLIPQEYIFTINSNEQNFLADISDFTKKFRSYIEEGERTGKIYEEDSEFLYNLEKPVKFYHLKEHLFQPLLYKGGQKYEFIKISPVQLVESEQKFLLQLRDFIEDNNDYDKIYLLRNPSRIGIGFFQTANFYPDFILWTIKGAEQTINFIDPKGLAKMDTTDEKFDLFSEIKKLEKKLNDQNKSNFKLNAFIMSINSSSDMEQKFDMSVSELQKRNILFLQNKDSIKTMFDIIKHNVVYS